MRKLRAFKIKPDEQQRVGAHIDTIYNTKDVGQWFSIQEIKGKRVLFIVTEPEYMEEDHLDDIRHRASDQT